MPKQNIKENAEGRKSHAIDPIAGFVRDACQIGLRCRCSRKDLLSWYRRWCAEENVVSVDAKTFARWVRNHGASDARSNGETRWIGIRPARSRRIDLSERDPLGGVPTVEEKEEAWGTGVEREEEIDQSKWEEYCTKLDVEWRPVRLKKEPRQEDVELAEAYGEVAGVFDAEMMTVWRWGSGWRTWRARAETRRRTVVDGLLGSAKVSAHGFRETRLVMLDLDVHQEMSRRRREQLIVRAMEQAQRVMPAHLGCFTRRGGRLVWKLSRAVEGAEAARMAAGLVSEVDVPGVLVEAFPRQVGDGLWAGCSLPMLGQGRDRRAEVARFCSESGVEPEDLLIAVEKEEEEQAGEEPKRRRSVRPPSEEYEKLEGSEFAEELMRIFEGGIGRGRHYAEGTRAWAGFCYLSPDAETALARIEAWVGLGHHASRRCREDPRHVLRDARRSVRKFERLVDGGGGRFRFGGMRSRAGERYVRMLDGLVERVDESMPMVA